MHDALFWFVHSIILWINIIASISIYKCISPILLNMFQRKKCIWSKSFKFINFHGGQLQGVYCFLNSSFLLKKISIHAKQSRDGRRCCNSNRLFSSRLTLGFMVSCGFLSMWLSNTSAAAMVMPIVEAVAQQITRAEAEADMLETSCSNGSTNLALELDGRHAGQVLFAHSHSAAC